MDYPTRGPHSPDAAVVKFDHPAVALNFVTDCTLVRIFRQRDHRAEVLRECFRHSLDRIHNDVEAMTDYCREMIRAGIDTGDELEEAETITRALLLVILILQRENNGVE